MKKTPKYSYKLRPGYGSKKLLLELYTNGNPDALQHDLFELIERASFRITGIENLWMNDEIQYKGKAKFKTILITRDIWDFFFITGEKNQNAIIKLDALLSEHELFEKIEVDFSEYE